jgi:hypothetical protein
MIAQKRIHRFYRARLKGLPYASAADRLSFVPQAFHYRDLQAQGLTSRFQQFGIADTLTAKTKI